MVSSKSDVNASMRVESIARETVAEEVSSWEVKRFEDWRSVSSLTIESFVDPAEESMLAVELSSTREIGFGDSEDGGGGSPWMGRE